MLAPLSLALLCACGKEAPPAARELQEGSVLPPLAVQRLSGESITLQQDFRGKTVVLNVWATWCPPCRREMPSLQRLSATLDPQQFAVIGLSIDQDRLLATEFLREQGVAFANFFDHDARLTRQLDLQAYPQTLIIGADGRLLQRVLGEQDWSGAAMRRSLLQWHQGSRAGAAQLSQVQATGEAR